MDDDAQRGNGMHEMDYYKGVHSPWNMMPLHLMKEQNSLPMNKKIMSIIAERDAALHERSLALSEKKQAIAERDAALEQRDKAITDRDNALMERDNAIAALQFSCHFNNNGIQNRAKHMDHFADVSETRYNNIRETIVTQAVPLSILTPEDGNSSRLAKQAKSKNEISKAPRKKNEKRMREQDLNRRMNDTSNGTKKLKSEWDSQDLGLNLVNYDETTMPAPVCSCTGIRRQCYKWGSGGWQSSCCTTTLSVYPLPQMQNKRHARMGGRKMSGNVYSRLLTRAAAAGQDLSVPLDLKDYWLRHGTNAYVIIT